MIITMLTTALIIWVTLIIADYKARERIEKALNVAKEKINHTVTSISANALNALTEDESVEYMTVEDEIEHEQRRKQRNYPIK